MPKAKPYASVSLDLDNRWSYLKTHGDPSWTTYPSYLDAFIPRVLPILERRDWKITFFIVGQDGARNRESFVSP
jgi:peptidoglycan/xylan/chitin deacetylase (PgdA/CDA1 family)